MPKFAEVIASYFVQKSFDTGVPLTPMKLVKLVYIAHGWHLALTDEALISEPIEAWKYGPVVRTVYHNYKHFGSGQITNKVEDFPSSDGQLDDDKKAFLDKIWHEYGNYSGLQLSTLTHLRETPWDIVWNQQNGKERTGVIIANDLIKSHYKEKLQLAEEKQSR
jgi:uncharacterized phage-associated protein